MQFISEEERKAILAKRYQEIVDALKVAEAEPSRSMKEIVRVFVEDSQQFKEAHAAREGQDR